jgi:hypothetical protein
MPDLDAALKMVDVFSRLGTTHFDLSVIEHVVRADGSWLDVKVRGWQLKEASIPELRFKLPRVLTEADAKHYSVILRPRPLGGLEWVQLDDLGKGNVDRIWRYTFLVIQTSPGNFQAWLALNDASPDKYIAGDFALRLRRGINADLNASGAARLAGSRNFKPKYQSIGFPAVQAVRVEPVLASYPELDEAGVAAPAVEQRYFRPQPVRSDGNRKWARMEDVFRTAPLRKDGSGIDRSQADGWWCKWNAERGWSISEMAEKLPEVSEKAREEIARGHTAYPWLKAKWGFRAAGFLVPEKFSEKKPQISTSISPQPEIPSRQPEPLPDLPALTDDLDPGFDPDIFPGTGNDDWDPEELDPVAAEEAARLGVPSELVGLLDAELGITPELLALLAPGPADCAGTSIKTPGTVESIKSISSVQAGKPPMDETAIPADLAALIDPASRIEVDHFIKTLGVAVTHVIPRGALDPCIPARAASSWKEWERRRLDRILAQGRMSAEDINSICPGYCPSLKGKDLDNWAEQYDQANQKRRKGKSEEWLEAQREAGRTWARWERWRREKPQQAEEWRRQHQDAAGDLLWMLRFAKPASEKTRQAVERTLREYKAQLKTIAGPPQTACRACCGTRYRRKRSGDWLCAICHPPPTPADAVEWSGPAQESAADIAARLGKHISPETGIWPMAEWGSECARALPDSVLDQGARYKAARRNAQTVSRKSKRDRDSDALYVDPSSSPGTKS